MSIEQVVPFWVFENRSQSPFLKEGFASLKVEVNSFEY